VKRKTIEGMRASLEALCVSIPSPAAAVLAGCGVLAANAAYVRTFGGQDEKNSRVVAAAECVEEAIRTCRPVTGTVSLPQPEGDGRLIVRCIPVVERSGSAACALIILDTTDTRHDAEPGAACRESAVELNEHLRLLAGGTRMPIGHIDRTDPLGDVKQSFNAALETVEHMLSVSGVFGDRSDRDREEIPMKTRKMNKDSVRDPSPTIVEGEGGVVFYDTPEGLARLRDKIAGEPAISGVVVFVPRDRIEGLQRVDDDG